MTQFSIKAEIQAGDGIYCKVKDVNYDDDLKKVAKIIA